MADRTDENLSPELSRAIHACANFFKASRDFAGAESCRQESALQLYEVAAGLSTRPTLGALWDAIKRRGAPSPRRHTLMPVSPPEPRDDVLLCVLGFLTPGDLSACALVSKRWRKCSFVVGTWAAFCRQNRIKPVPQIEGVCDLAMWREAVATWADTEHADIVTRLWDGAKLTPVLPKSSLPRLPSPVPVTSSVSVSVIGPSLVGKQCLVTALVTECGGLDPRARKLFEEQKERQGIAFTHALLAARYHEKEPSRYVSVHSIDTIQHQCTILDGPVSYSIKALTTVLALSDVAILVVSEDRVDEATIIMHALVAFSLGVKRLIVVVNKMDEDTISYSRDRFRAMCGRIEALVSKVGWPNDRLSFIPTAALVQENIGARSSKMPWSVPLYRVLCELREPLRSVQKPLRFLVRSVHRVGGIGTIVVGRIVSGAMQAGQQIVFENGLGSKAWSIESYHIPTSTAHAGQFIGVYVRLPRAAISRGFVCGDPENDPPRETESFLARVVVLHPEKFKVGFSPVVHVHLAHVCCRISEIVSRVDRVTSSVLEEHPPRLRRGEHGIIRFVPLKPLCVERFDRYPVLGRITVIDGNRSVSMIGRVLDVKTKT